MPELCDAVATPDGIDFVWQVAAEKSALPTSKAATPRERELTVTVTPHFRRIDGD